MFLLTAAAFADVSYNYCIMEPRAARGLSYEDTLIDITFSPNSSEIDFKLKNKSKGTMQVDWDKVAFVDFDGSSHKVMHVGVKYNDRNNSIPPSVIPPGATLDDLIYPTDYASWGGHEWDKKPMWPLDWEAAQRISGKTVDVYLPITVDGKTYPYKFSIRVGASES
ncbi:MAG: hypothetical protein ACYCW6_00155 [Candidatus Xenobia bacterium]